MAFNCDFNRLTSLLGAPRYINGTFSCLYNKLLTDCSDLWNCEINGKIHITLNKNIAILPLVKFTVFIMNEFKINEILKNHHGFSKQNIIDCQYDLIENGYADNAKWKP